MALVDTIEWRDDTGSQLVHRWPENGPGDIRMGSQLVVRESQVAVFFRDGKALDTFDPGRHTLTTLNLPLMGTLLNIVFGQTPFQAEVYFTSTRIHTGLKWGTPQAIIFRDTELSTVNLRSYGSYTLRVDNPQLFVNNVVGTEHVYTEDALNEWLRGFIVSRYTDVLGQVMKTVLDLPQYYDEIGVAVKSRVREDFTRYGLELVDFIIEAITLPDEVQQMINERASMEAVGDMGRYTQFKTAKAIGDMPNAQGGDGTAAAGMGMGMGAAMGAAMAQSMRDAADSSNETPKQPAQPASNAAETALPTSPAGAKFCSNCGGPLVPNAKFCSECGAKVGGQ